MIIVIDRNVFVRGELYEVSDEPIDLDDQDALALVHMNKAHLLSVSEATEPEPAPGEKLPAPIVDKLKKIAKAKRRSGK